jgi:hypothetical protein
MPAEAPAPNLLRLPANACPPTQIYGPADARPGLTDSILVPVMAQDASSSLLKPFINPSDAYQGPTGTPDTSATNETDAPLR